jgi:hypothetical protein
MRNTGSSWLTPHENMLKGQRLVKVVDVEDLVALGDRKNAEVAQVCITA